MPKVNRNGTTSTPFPFARQFTAPPFFVGLEDAKLRGKLLLDAVQRRKKAPAGVLPAKKKPASAAKKTKTAKKK